MQARTKGTVGNKTVTRRVNLLYDMQELLREFEAEFEQNSTTLAMHEHIAEISNELHMDIHSDGDY